MYMNANILDAEIGPFFDGVSVNVYDQDAKQTYQAVIVEGLAGVRELLQLKRQKGTKVDEELEAMAAQVEMPPLMQPVALIVKRIKLNKGFMKLVCGLAEASA